MTATTIIAGVPAMIVRHPRARRVRLAVDPARRMLRLSVPPRASLSRAIAWAEEQRTWIECEVGRLTPPVVITDGCRIPFLGETVTVRHAAGERRGCRLVDGSLIVGGDADRVAATVLRWLRREALAILSADTAEFAHRAGVGVARVAIGETRSRWGSCSSAGVIRYSWRLVMAPRFVRRATVAHEVAHRLHMDHSPAFHAALAGIADGAGDAALSRDWLRAHGAGLHQIGGSSGPSS